MAVPGMSLHYEFAHRALPYLMHARREQTYQFLGEASGDAFLNGLWKTLAANRNSDQPCDGLRVTQRMSPADGFEAVLIEMPKPEKSPEAFAAAAVFQIGALQEEKEIKAARYFTLEKGRSARDPEQELYFLCEWVQPTQHANFGVLPTLDGAAFLDAVGQILRGQYKPQMQ